MNHYETLGVDRSATADEIKKSYKRLASKHHPDRPGGNTQEFQKIQAAYDILSDDQKREMHNMELDGVNRPQFNFNTSNMTGGPNDGMHDAMFDILRQQFGFNMGGFQQRRPPQNQDIRISIILDLADTLQEHSKTLNIIIPGNNQETVNIKVPRGIHHGAVIRYPGLGGNAVTTAPRADLYVQFHVKEHPEFVQQGTDLIMSLTIDCFDAIIGCERTVTNIDGRVFNVVIPPGSQPGRKFGIPDAGLYSTDKSGRGKLIILLNVVIPEKLSAEHLETIKSIKTAINI